MTFTNHSVAPKITKGIFFLNPHFEVPQVLFRLWKYFLTLDLGEGSRSPGARKVLFSNWSTRSSLAATKIFRLTRSVTWEERVGDLGPKHFCFLNRYFRLPVVVLSRKSQRNLLKILGKLLKSRENFWKVGRTSIKLRKSTYGLSFWDFRLFSLNRFIRGFDWHVLYATLYI